jgi:hypothetical protein
VSFERDARCKHGETNPGGGRDCSECWREELTVMKAAEAGIEAVNGPANIFCASMPHWCPVCGAPTLKGFWRVSPEKKDVGTFVVCEADECEFVARSP